MIKGFAVDCLLEKLWALGFSNTYVEWGGDIRASGEHPEGRPWNILLHFFSKETEVFPLQDCALATSGDYEQIWETESGSYSHIIDPKSKQAIKRRSHSLAAVTVKAPNCALADALATACMTFSSAEEAHTWANKLTEKNPKLTFWIASYD